MGLTTANIAQNSYPVGSIYISVDGTNPATALGFGTWEAWGQGRVPMGVGSISANTFNDFGTVTAGNINRTAAEELGGADTHTLTATQMPAHSHNMPGIESTNNAPWAAPNMALLYKYISGTPTVPNVFSATASETGGSRPHNNVQPYITAYMWKRTN